MSLIGYLIILIFVTINYSNGYYSNFLPHVHYHGDGCQCQKKISYQVDEPYYSDRPYRPIYYEYAVKPLPPKIQEEVNYSFDVGIEQPVEEPMILPSYHHNTVYPPHPPPVEAKKLIFNYFVEVPLPPKNNVLLGELSGRIDKISLSKPDCFNREFACPCMGQKSYEGKHVNCPYMNNESRGMSFLDTIYNLPIKYESNFEENNTPSGRYARSIDNPRWFNKRQDDNTYYSEIFRPVENPPLFQGSIIGSLKEKLLQKRSQIEQQLENRRRRRQNICIFDKLAESFGKPINFDGGPTKFLDINNRYRRAADQQLQSRGQQIIPPSNNNNNKMDQYYYQEPNVYAGPYYPTRPCPLCRKLTPANIPNCVHCGNSYQMNEPIVQNVNNHPVNSFEKPMALPSPQHADSKMKERIVDDWSNSKRPINDNSRSSASTNPYEQVPAEVYYNILRTILHHNSDFMKSTNAGDPSRLLPPPNELVTDALAFIREVLTDRDDGHSHLRMVDKFQHQPIEAIKEIVNNKHINAQIERNVNTQMIDEIRKPENMQQPRRPNVKPTDVSDIGQTVSEKIVPEPHFALRKTLKTLKNGKQIELIDFGDVNNNSDFDAEEIMKILNSEAFEQADKKAAAYRRDIEIQPTNLNN